MECAIASSVRRLGIRRIICIFLTFTLGYWLGLYQEGLRHTNSTKNTTNNKPAVSVSVSKGWPETVPLPEDCCNLAPISTADDLPKLCGCPVRRKLNQPGLKGKRMRPDDARIIKYIRINCNVLLRPPDGKPTKYKGLDASRGQDEIAIRLLKNMTGGFFVEFGALDGVKESNSLRFERDLGWKGLLIEPDPQNLVNLYRNHRNAWISHSCVAVKPYPHEVIFQPKSNTGKIKQVLGKSSTEKPLEKGLIRVQCFPLISYLVVLNISVADFMSVDVEGFELAILKTILFKKIFFRVIIVEIVTSRSSKPTPKFMKSKGFKTVGIFYRQPDLKPHDIIFVHNSVQVEQSAIDLIESKYYNPLFYSHLNLSKSKV